MRCLWRRIFIWAVSPFAGEGWWTGRACSGEAKALLDRFDVALDPATLVKDRVGQKQLVEIVKALGKNSKILILDEPTAALAEHEVQVLLDILRDLRRRGIACIYISHKLEEVTAIADRITVLRDGRSITTMRAAETNRAEVISKMVGRELGDLFPCWASKAGEVLMSVQGLCVHDEHGGERLHEVSFELRAGEVLGIGGLMGAGRTELLMHLYGAWGTRSKGVVKLAGRELKGGDPVRTLREGLALVSEDRRRYGLILEEEISFNLSLSSLDAVTYMGLVIGARRRDGTGGVPTSFR